MSGDLIEFLRARLDEDEARAKQGEWAAEFLSQGGSKDPGSKRAYGKAVMREGGWPPARVLAEVDAKRRIIYLHDSDGAHECPAGYDPPGDVYVGYERECLTLRLLALPYAGHADYRPEWAPQ